MGDGADAWDDLIFGRGEEEEECEEWFTTTVTCKKCGTRNLHWRQHKSGKWWLVTPEQDWHNCKEV